MTHADTYAPIRHWQPAFPAAPDCTSGAGAPERRRDRLHAV